MKKQIMKQAMDKMVTATGMSKKQISEFIGQCPKEDTPKRKKDK
jgi:hypothetical protein